MEDHGHTFLDIEKNFTKTKFQRGLVSFRTVGALTTLEAIAKLDKT